MAASVISCRAFRGRRRVELDHGLRFLVGQPHDQVVVGFVARKRIVRVLGQRLHLRRGRDRELVSLFLLAEWNRLIARKNADVPGT